MQPAAEIDQNLVCDDAVRDPHAYFAALREQDPVFWNDRHRAWVLTRHADVGAALRSPLLTAERITPFASAVQTASESDNVDVTFQVLKDWLVFKDPPEHTRLRRLVARAFTPTVVKARMDEIGQTITELVSQLDGDADLLREFAYPLPAVVIAQMLGVPPEDRDLFKEWSDKITALVFGAYGEDDRFETAARGMIELRDYLVELIGQYERRPGDNLISMLLEQEDGDALSREELVATCTLLLFGGHETTTNLIGNGMLALLSNRVSSPAYLGRARSHRPGDRRTPALRRPGGATVRMVKEEHTIEGRTLSPGGARVPRQPGRQPRPGGVRRTERTRRRTAPDQPSRFRRRHPLLPRCATCPAGGPARDHRARPELSGHATRRRTRRSSRGTPRCCHAASSGCRSRSPADHRPPDSRPPHHEENDMDVTGLMRQSARFNAHRTAVRARRPTVDLRARPGTVRCVSPTDCSRWTATRRSCRCARGQLDRSPGLLRRCRASPGSSVCRCTPRNSYESHQHMLGPHRVSSAGGGRRTTGPTSPG